VKSKPTSKPEVPVQSPRPAGVAPQSSKPKSTSTVGVNAAQIRAKMLARQTDIYRTMIPTCLIVGVTLPILAGVWFLLDPSSVARKLPMWMPLSSAGLGLVSMLLGFALMSKVQNYLRSIPRAV